MGVNDRITCSTRKSFTKMRPFSDMKAEINPSLSDWTREVARFERRERKRRMRNVPLDFCEKPMVERYQKGVWERKRSRAEVREIEGKKNRRKKPIASLRTAFKVSYAGGAPKKIFLRRPHRNWQYLIEIFFLRPIGNIFIF